MKRKDQDELGALVEAVAGRVKKKARLLAEDAAGELVQEIQQKSLKALIRWGDKTFGGGK